MLHRPEVIAAFSKVLSLASPPNHNPCVLFTPLPPRILYLRCTKKCGRDQSTLCAAFCLLTSLCDTVGAILARQLTIQVCPSQAWLLFLCGSHTGLCLSPQPTEKFPLGTRALSFLFSQAPPPPPCIITSLKHLKHLFKNTF